MVLHQDFKELLELLNANQVEYLVVGAFALGFYGAPRSTGDIDIWIRVSEENAKRIEKALREFGMSSVGYRSSDFLDKNLVIQLGVPPVRIDIIMGISGVEFNDAYTKRETIKSDGTTINYISKEDFIKNKKASGRLKDLADVERLTQTGEE